MFFRDTTVRTSNYSFGIRNDPMNPWKKLSCRFYISKDNFVMKHILPFCRSSIGSPSIGTNRLQKILSFFSCGTASKSLQKVLNGVSRSIVHHLHMSEARMLQSLMISIQRYRAKNRALSLAPSPSFRSLGSEKRIIHLYQPRKAISGISIRHCFANLVRHQPRCSVLFDIKKSLHLCYRYPNFVHRHMVKQPILLHQRRPGTVKNRSCCYTYLKPANFTVEKLSLGKIPGFLMSAPWANKSIWPSLVCKVLCTCFIIWKFLLELYQTTFFVFLGHLFTCPRIYLRSY